MDCNCESKQDKTVKEKLHHVHHDLVDGARRILRSATDPVSAVVRFLQERPENVSVPGNVLLYVLRETFQEKEIPGLVRILSAHVREVIRSKNDVIDIINMHPAVERWGDYLLKQKDRIKFEIAREREWFAIKNIVGITAIEHGIELPLEKILIKPPKLVVTVRLGPLHPERVLDIV
jgi:hypothetical protein